MKKEDTEELSGTILVSCNDHKCKEVAKKAKETQGVTSVFQTKNDEDIDLVVSMKNSTKEEIINFKNMIIGMKGAKSIKYRITK